jgi:L-asparaginase
MNPDVSFEGEELREGTGGVYPPKSALEPGELLGNVLHLVPELGHLGASLELQIVLNCDSCRLTPDDWIILARRLHEHRDNCDSFVVISGTDTLAYVGSALSFLLRGFNKPIIITGSQRPLAMPRTDARQNLVDSVSCAVAGVGVLNEVCICFGGLLLRANRTQKTHSSAYRAFTSPTFPTLAKLGVDVVFNHNVLLAPTEYTPRFDLTSSVMRVPIVPGLDPWQAYGSVAERGIKGVVLEVFGVGNCDDRESAGWVRCLCLCTQL